MSNEINKLKNKLKVIRPLLQKDRIKLDEMKLEMQAKQELLDCAVEKYTSVLCQKQELIEAMQSSLVTDQVISVGNMNNSRHFLDEVEKNLQLAEQDVKTRKQTLADLRQRVLDHRLSINKLEKYKDKKDQSLFVEIEKDHMHLMDDLWMHRSASKEES